MADALYQLVADHTLRTVALGAVAIGLVAGTLGTFAVLRRQSLLGDAISHATLPGVVIAFLLTLSKEPVVLLLGALAVGWLGALAMQFIIDRTRIKSDSALGVVMSVFFGAGLVLLSYVQLLPTAAKAGLNKFLFGNASTLMQRDVITIAVLGLIAMGLLLLFWKEFKLLTFDSAFARALGYPTGWINVLLTSLVIVAIVAGLQAVGAVLMSAMLVAPAAAARQWSNRLDVVTLAAALIGGLSGGIGAVISSRVADLPTGPAIVLVVTVLVVLSLLFAPSRGLLWAYWREQRQRVEVRELRTLSCLYRLVEHHSDPLKPHDMAALRAIGISCTPSRLAEMARKGWIKRADRDRWGLTIVGLEKARTITRGSEVA